MEEYLRKIRVIEGKCIKPEDLFQHLKHAHAITVQGILRELKRQKLGDNELQRAKIFLRLGGYDEKGMAIDATEHAYYEGLRLQEENKIHVLAAIQQAVETLTNTARTNNLIKSSTSNPLSHINNNVNTAKQFIERDFEPAAEQHVQEDINISGLSSYAKKRLLLYLARKR